MMLFSRVWCRTVFLLTVLCTVPCATAAIPDTGSRLPRLAAAPGRFLVATPRMAFNYFRESIILLTRHDSHGSTGVIINRPTILSLADLLPEYRHRITSVTLFEGGPVQPAELSLLLKREGSHRTLAADGDGELTFFPGTRQVLNVLPAIAPSLDYRIYNGYCGWSPGQLQSEIRRGAWLVMEGDAALLFETYPDLLWQRMLRRVQDQGAAR